MCVLCLLCVYKYTHILYIFFNIYMYIHLYICYYYILYYIKIYLIYKQHIFLKHTHAFVCIYIQYLTEVSTPPHIFVNILLYLFM